MSSGAVAALARARPSSRYSLTVGQYARMNIPAVKIVQTNTAFTHDMTLHGNSITGGTFSDNSSLPSGSSINSSTGQISGTITSAGVYDYEVTYSTGAGVRNNHRVVSRIHVYSTLTTIDGTGSYGGDGSAGSPWLFTDPHNYDTDNTCYQYTGHCRYDTQAGFTSARWVAVDFNGYTIEYDAETDENAITNGNFGTGDTTGWTTIPSGVTVATGTVAARTAWKDNEYTANISLNASETKILKTNNVTLTADRWYCVTWLLLIGASAGYSSTKVVVGTNDSSSLGTGESTDDAGNFRPGTFGYYIFQADSGQTVPVEFHITNTDGSARTFYLTECNLDRAKVTGISSGFNQTNHPYTDAGASGSTNAEVTVANGTFNQLNFSHGNGINIGGGGCPMVDSVEMLWNNRCMSGQYPIAAAGNQCVIVNNNRIDTPCEKITSRDNLNGALVSIASASVGHAGTHFNGNNVPRTPQAGGFNTPSATGYEFAATLDSNIIRIDGFYTNGFGLYGPDQSDFQGSCAFNTITCPNGRGIRMRSYCDYHDNVLDVDAKAVNLEYAGVWLGGAYCVQIEASPTSIDIRNETYITRGLGGGACFRYNGAAGDASMTIRDCSLEVIATALSPPYDHSLIKLNSPAATDLAFDNCTFKSNHHLFDFGSGVTTDATIDSSSFEIDDGAYYTAGEPWVTLTSGTVTVNNPVTYIGTNTQTEIETKAASDSAVTVP